MAKLCETCVHYEPDKHYKQLGTCGNTYFLRGYSYDPAEMPVDGLLLENDEGWAWLVGPKFGCVHHKER